MPVYKRCKCNCAKWHSAHAQKHVSPLFFRPDSSTIDATAFGWHRDAKRLLFSRCLFLSRKRRPRFNRALSLPPGSFLLYQTLIRYRGQRKGLPGGGQRGLNKLFPLLLIDMSQNGEPRGGRGLFMPRGYHNLILAPISIDGPAP